MEKSNDWFNGFLAGLKRADALFVETHKEQQEKWNSLLGRSSLGKEALKKRWNHEDGAGRN